VRRNILIVPYLLRHTLNWCKKLKWLGTKENKTFDNSTNNTVQLFTEKNAPQYEGLLREAETHMVWNVKIVIGQPDAVPAHLVDQVFPDDDNLLAAVLDPDRKNKARHL